MQKILANRRRRLLIVLLSLAFICAGRVIAQEVVIESLSRNGQLTWSNASVHATCRVEWAPAIEGPWHASWDALTNIVITNHIGSATVPMFYRVVASATPPAWLTNVSASEALTLVTNRQNDPNFATIDVRTPSEFQTKHIKGAINLDFYSATFQSGLRALNTNRTFLVYCASGNRSRQATQIMQDMGFNRIYNMTQGFSAFAALPGAGPYLEP